MRWILPLLFLFTTIQAKQLDLNIGAEGAILMNANTGVILFEKNAYTQAFPASTTKIATAIYALHQNSKELGKKMCATRESIASISPQAKRQSNYRSPPHWLETDGTHVGIKSGEELRFYDLLCAVLISSANDASNVIAQNLGGTIPAFMAQLNQYLKEIGCTGTTFNNPHGLHHPEHFTTPYDLAVMAKHGLENPIFRTIVSMSRYECPQTNLEYPRTFLQTNQLLRNGSFSYSKAIGVKTGTTQAAGKNLVAAAEENGRCLIAVVLGYRGARSEVYQDVIKLFESAFNEPKMRRYLLKKGAANLTTHIAGARKKLHTSLPEGLYYDFYPAEECAVKARVNWKIPPFPIRVGDQVGSVQVVDVRNSVLCDTPLFAAEELKSTVWYWCAQRFSKEDRGKTLLFLGVAGCISFLIWRLRRRRTTHPLF